MEKAVQSVVRCFAILHALNLDNGASLKTLSATVDLPRGTVYRLVLTLIREGYVRKDPYAGGYWLERKVRELGVGYRDQEWILGNTTATVMNDLHHELGWCLALSTPDRDTMLVRLATERRHPEGARTIAGIRTPFLKYGAGYTYLAHCEPDERERTLDRIFARDAAATSAGNLERDAVVEELRHIRTAGYGVRYADRRSRQLSVPVFHGGQAAGVLSMTYFASAVSAIDIPARFVPRLRETADTIARV